MKRALFAIAGLVCMTGSAAHAQSQNVQPSGPPAPVAPVAPAAPGAPVRACALVTQAGDKYAETPLAGFDPAATGQPLPAVTAAGAVMVVCTRTTIVPEVTDYRVLTELRLPLSITAGGKTLFLGASGGRLQAGAPGGQLSPEDSAAVSARLDQMEAAMAAASAKK